MSQWSRLIHYLSPVFLLGGLLPFSLFGYQGGFPPSEVAQLSSLLVCVCAFLALVLVGRQCVAARFKKLFPMAILLVWMLLLLLTVANWWHEQYFRSYFSWIQLGFGADIWQVAGAWTAFEHKREAAMLAAWSFPLLLLAAISHRPLSYRSGFVNIIATLLLIVFLYGSWLIHQSYRFYSDSNQLSLTSDFYHPVHAFFISNKNGTDITEAESRANQQFRKRNKKSNNGDDKILPEAVTLEQKRYNVIIIMMESMRASMMGYYGNPDNLTPHLDGLAKKYIVANNYYANTSYTLKSEVGAWCGIFDNYAKPPLSKEPDLSTHLQCLPDILNQRDYRTIYYHGHEAKFYDRKQFLPKIGFNEMHFYKDDQEWQEKNKTPHIIGWGLSDKELFDYVADDLFGGKKQPFFAHIMTLSSHYPFNNDWGVSVPFPVHRTIKNPAEAYQNYQNAAHYLDGVIGGFFEKFLKSPLSRNTIVVVTGDHGVWSFPEGLQDPVLQNEYLFRSPMIIYHPDIHSHMEVEQISSHVDILPTLLAMLGESEKSDEYAGKDMLTKVQQPWAIMMKNGSAMVRIENQLCQRSNQICGGVQQDCISVYPEVINQKELQDACYEISGDLLKGGNYVPSTGVNDYVNEAIHFISYQNKEAILK